MQINPTVASFLSVDANTEQLTVLNEMEAFVSATHPDDFLILCGAAGTGKTCITSALVAFLNHKGIDYRIAAPTGRAAKILGRKAGCTSETIHTLIYTAETNDEGQVTWLPKQNLIKDQCIFIVDEASMVPSKASLDPYSMFISERAVLPDILTYLKEGNSANKIIFLGDSNQLPPVHEETSYALSTQYLAQTFKLTGKAFELKQVHRQAGGSSILDIACELRNCIDNNIYDMPVIKANRYKNYFHAANAYCRNFAIDNYEHSVCIARTHVQNNSMNNEIRLNIFGGKVGVLTEGDLMMVNQNWSRGEMRLSNGDHVIIERIDWAQKRVVAGLTFVPVAVAYKNSIGEKCIVEDWLLLDIVTAENHQLTATQRKNLWAERIRYNRILQRTKKPFDDPYVGALNLIYGHSITAHKAQGGEWKKVYVNTYGVRHPKWMYTAITRAQKVLEVF